MPSFGFFPQEMKVAFHGLFAGQFDGTKVLRLGRTLVIEFGTARPRRRLSPAVKQVFSDPSDEVPAELSHSGEPGTDKASVGHHDGLNGRSDETMQGVEEGTLDGGVSVRFQRMDFFVYVPT